MESRLKYKIQQYKDAVMNFEESLSIDFTGLSERIVDSIKMEEFRNLNSALSYCGKR